MQVYNLSLAQFCGFSIGGFGPPVNIENTLWWLSAIHSFLKTPIKTLNTLAKFISNV